MGQIIFLPKGGEIVANIRSILGYSFEMDYPLNTTTFNNVGAVYVIYANQRWLDVGETGELGNRIANHDRKPDWQRNAGGLPIFVGVHQEGNEATRLAIESTLRNSLNPVCGDR